MRGRTIAGLLLLALQSGAQHGSTTVVNPYTKPEDQLLGAKLYRAQCAGCHGLEGAGTGTGPDLISGKFRHGSSDEALFQTISKGVPGTPMPAFSSFTGLQVWQLVTHIRSLSIRRATEFAKGNPEAGAGLFKANCSGCHTTGKGEGGFTGPDLSDIGARRTVPELREAIEDPHSEVDSRYWSVSIKTSSGETLQGIRLNEDTSSMQLRDKSGRLVSVLKRNITASQLNRKSPMPDFTGKLKAEQLDDVIAFLTRLREEQE